MADAGSGNLYFDLRGKLYSVPADDQKALAELQQLGATQLDEREGTVRRFVTEYKDSTVAPFLYGVGKGLTFNMLPAALEGAGILEEGESEAIERAAPTAVLGGEVTGALAPLVATLGGSAPVSAGALATRAGTAGLRELGEEATEQALKGLTARGLAGSTARGAINVAATPTRVVSEQALKVGQKVGDLIPGETLFSRAARTVVPGAVAGGIEGSLYAAGARFNEELITNPDATIQEALILGAKDMGEGFLWGSAFGGGISAALAGTAKTFQGAKNIAQKAYKGAFDRFGEGFSDRVARMIMTGDDESREAFQRKLYQVLDPNNDFNLKAMQSQITQAENVSSAFRDTLAEFRIERRIGVLDRKILSAEKADLARDVGRVRAEAAEQARQATAPIRQEIEEAREFIELYKQKDYEARAAERGLKVLNAEKKAEELAKQEQKLADATKRLEEAEAAAKAEAQEVVGKVEPKLAKKREKLAKKRGEIADVRFVSKKSVAELRQIFAERSRSLIDRIEEANQKAQLADANQQPAQAKKLRADVSKEEEELRALRRKHQEEIIDLAYNQQAIKEVGKEELNYLNGIYREALADPAADPALIKKAEQRINEALDAAEKDLLESTDSLLTEINKLNKDIGELDTLGEREQKRFFTQAKAEKKELAKNTEAAKQKYEDSIIEAYEELKNPITSGNGTWIDRSEMTPLARAQVQQFRKDIRSEEQVRYISKELLERSQNALKSFFKQFDEQNITAEQGMPKSDYDVFKSLKEDYDLIFDFSNPNSVVRRINDMAKDFRPDDPAWSQRFYKEYLRAIKNVQNMNNTIFDLSQGPSSKMLSDLTNFKDDVANIIYDQYSTTSGTRPILPENTRLFGKASDIYKNVRMLRSFVSSGKRNLMSPQARAKATAEIADVSDAILNIQRTIGDGPVKIDLQNVKQQIRNYDEARSLERAFDAALKDLEGFNVLNQRNYDKAMQRFDPYFNRQIDAFEDPAFTQGFNASRENLKTIIGTRELVSGKLDDLKEQYRLGTEEAIRQAEISKQAKEAISKSFGSLRRKQEELIEKYKSAKDNKKQLTDREMQDLITQRIELREQHQLEIAKAQQKLRDANVRPGDEANIIAKSIDEMNVGEQDLVALLKDQLRAEPKKFRDTILLLNAVKDEKMRKLRLQEAGLLTKVRDLETQLKAAKASERRPISDDIVKAQSDINGIKAQRKQIIQQYKDKGPSPERAVAARELEELRVIFEGSRNEAAAKIDELAESFAQAAEESLSDTFARIRQIDEDLFQSQQKNIEINKNEAERLKNLSKEVDPDVRRILDYRKRDRFGSIANFFGLELLTDFGGALLPGGVSAGIFLGSKLIDQPRDVLRITGGLLGLSSKMGELIDKGAKATVERVTKPGFVTSISKTGEERRVSPLYQLIGIGQDYTDEPNKPLTQEQYNKVSEEIRKKATDTEGMQTMMDRSVTPFKGIKKLQGPAMAAPGRTLNFLNSLVPQQPSMGLFDYTQKVTPPEQRQALKNAMLVVRDPVNTFFDQLQTNTLSPMTVQAMRVIYPDVTNQIIEATLNAFSASGKQIPYTTRLALSSGLSAGLDSSVQPANVQLFQLNFQNQGPGQQQGGQATVNAGALTQMPAAQQTGVNRVSSK